jgi:protein subunit release factor B
MLISTVGTKNQKEAGNMGKKKELLFSLGPGDFDWEFFKSSGPGGQNKNKRDTACRCIHRPSGAVGTAAEEREQGRNRKLAFRRCVESEQFKSWHRMECARRMLSGDEKRKIEERIDKELKNEENILVEVMDNSGKWVGERKGVLCDPQLD